MRRILETDIENVGRRRYEKVGERKRNVHNG